jgi:hypothetical protein
MTCKENKENIGFAEQKWGNISINPFHSLMKVYLNTTSCKENKENIGFAEQKWGNISINPFHSLMKVYSNTTSLWWEYDLSPFQVKWI